MLVHILMRFCSIKVTNQSCGCMLIDPEEYLYDGKITRDEDCRIGYAGQFSVRDKDQDCTVFEYLSRRFIENQQEIAAVCDEMAKADDVEALFEKYQTLLDMHA